MFDSKTTIFVIATIFIMLLSYGLFVARDLRSSPQIIFLQGDPYLETSSTSVEYIFSLNNADRVYFKGEEQALNELGQLQLRVYPFIGLNYYKLEADNNFNRKADSSFIIFRSK